MPAHGSSASLCFAASWGASDNAPVFDSGQFRCEIDQMRSAGRARPRGGEKRAFTRLRGHGSPLQRSRPDPRTEYKPFERRPAFKVARPRCAELAEKVYIAALLHAPS